MADVKISQLPAATTPLAGTEQIPLVQSSTTKQVTVSNLLTAANLGTPTAINLTNATNVPVNQAIGILAVSHGGTGTATPSIVGGTNIAVSGTWPNQTISASGSAAGNVTGPVSSTDNAVVRFDNTTGQVIQNSGVIISDSNVITGGTWNGATVGVAYGGTGATTLTGIVKGSGTSAFSAATAGTDYVAPSGALGTPSSGTATNLTGLPLTTGVTGTLPIANGGTNATTATAARGNILPSYTGNANKVLAVNSGATDVEYVTVGGTGTVTSVAVSGGTTGLTTSGGPITGAGTITLAGTLAVANGGTGTTTPAIVAGTNVTVSGSWPNQTINATGSAQVYPSAGIANSTGTAWGTSYTTTGTGTVLALATSPTFVTPVLGTPTSATLTNATGLPISTGVSGLGTGVATFLATPSSANLAATVTDETGTGSLVFATSPTLVTPILGTPTSATLTNATGLPLTTGVTGTLGVANGGTGATTLTANNVLLGNGTSAVQAIAPGSSGNVLTSNGTTWASTAPASGGLTRAQVTAISLVYGF
jgi:hypothetical protein